MLEEQSRTEIYLDPETSKDIRLCGENENHLKGVLKENIDDRGKVHLLRWKI